MNFFKENNSLARKIFVGLFLFFFVFNLLAAQPAKAQAVTVVQDLVAQAEAIKKKFKEAFETSFKKMGQAAGTALIKAMRTFLTKFAQDSANWVASGDFAKGPMWLQNPAEYFKNAGESAAADFIGTFGDEWDVTKKFGINLCSPQSPELNLKLKLQMAEINAPQPRCNFSEIKEAYSRMAEPAYWDKIGLGFEAGQNGLSLSRNSIEVIEELEKLAEEKAKQTTGNNGAGSLRPPTEAVSGDANAPAQIAEQAVGAIDPAQDAKETAERAKAIEVSMKEWNEYTMPSILKESGLLFLDTLANKIQEKLLKFGMLSVGKIGQWIKDSLKDTDPLAYEAQLVGRRQASEAYFADFTKPTFSEIEDYRSQYITEASLDCSSNNSSPFCGALDDDFINLLSRSQAGENVTVSEALKLGLLHGEWQLLGPGVPCTQNAYCYDNLVKLRVLRILPVGWEIAAKKSGQGSATLRQIVAGFYKDTHLFYHLIDPNWLIVAPKAKCGSEAFGSLFLVDPSSDSPGQRSKYCADIQNCVGEDPKTGICNSWGYCLKEKNYWKINGDACDAQFNTCTTYTGPNSQVASYLSNTLDKGICTADNAGCRGYALTQSFSTSSITWNWQVDDTDKKIFFSQNIETCDSTNEGCTKFIRQSPPEVFNQSLYLKKAPEYYNCYGEKNSDLSNTWPANKADLYKIFDKQSAAQKTACANFAQVCSAEEKGCEMYTPNNGNPAVPGILSTNDQCPSECVGYEKYVEQPITQFSGSSVNYFIASSANSCSSDYAGCDEFVNLEGQTAGGEQKEYYTELRTCSKEEADGATFYTWEGSDTTGYQLKTYTLKDADTNGQPDYNTTDGAILADYNIQCNAEIYAGRVASGSSFNPDCREFYNRQGNKSYRLYSKTVTVSTTACKKLRKTISDSLNCLATGGSWDATQNFCTYLSITDEAKSCPAKASGCRAYKGNSGNNFQTIYSADFESGVIGSSAQVGWNGTISSESTVVGGKSLKVSGGTWQTFASSKNKTYLVYFWAKGDKTELSVNFFQSNAQGALNGPGSEFQNFNLNNNWSSYTAGPFTVAWDSAVSSSTIKFSLSSGQSLYLDNVVVKEMTSNIYVIRDSWSTPAACDNVLGDPNGETAGGYADNPLRLVPQAQLGCTNYQNRQGAEVAAKSFINLCRAEAVGCEELIDTANTETASSTIVNAVCQLTSNGSTPVVSQSNQAIGCKDKTGEIRCDILPNQSNCRFTIITNSAEESDAIFELPALGGNTVSDVEGNSYKIGVTIDNGYVFLPADKTVYLVNDAQFQCASDNVSCQAVGKISYNETGKKIGSTVYVKNNPEKYSTILCEEKAEGCAKFAKSGGGADYFKDPTIYGNKLCEWKNPIDGTHPYGGWVIKGTDTACYVNTNYHLYNNKDIGKYNGSVGICPAEQNGCTEFIDPSGGGNSANPQGQSYYLLNNDKIDKGSCGNQASLQKGCVLFNQTNKGDLLWNAEKTYAASETSKYELVNPISEPGNNDANVILKVKRDRVCGEWLACASTMKVNIDGQLKEVCTELKNCDEAAIVSGQYSNELLGKCAHWVEGSYPGTNKILTEDAYQKIPDVATFKVKDFSGYSVVDGYQISNLVVSETGLKSSTPGAIGVFTNDKNSLAESCRGFASEEASFGQEKLCSLTKVTYGGDDTYPVDKYYEYNYLLDASGVCNGGYTETGESKKGFTCFTDADCANDQAKTSASSATITPVCLLNKKVSRELGWNGYCLITDKVTKACLQWFPLTVPSNSINIYALNRSAGYYPPESAGKYWCVEAKGNANRSYQRYETYLGFGADPLSSHHGDSDGWKEKKSISYGFIGRAASLTIVYNALKTNNDYYYGLTPQGNAPPSDKDLFGYSTSWAKRSFSANDYEKTINIKELAAIGLKIKYRTTDEYPLVDSEMMIFPDQTLDGIQNGGSGNPAIGYYWSGPLKFTSANNPMIYLDLVWSEINSATKNLINSSNYDFITETLCKKTEASGLVHRPNFAAIRFYFSSENGNLLRIETKLCDASKEDVGGFAVDVVYYLKEMCTDIRQVVDNTSSEAQKSPFGVLSKARTDRVWSQGNYWLGSGGSAVGLSNFMSYDQVNAPFGSLGKNDEVINLSLKEVLADKKTDYEKKMAIKKYGPWVFSLGNNSGTPVSCANDNGGDCGKVYLCDGGSHDGSTCLPDADKKYNGCYEEMSSGECKPVSETGKKYCQSLKSGESYLKAVSGKEFLIETGIENHRKAQNFFTCESVSDCLGSPDLGTCETGFGVCSSNKDEKCDPQQNGGLCSDGSTCLTVGLVNSKDYGSDLKTEVKLVQASHYCSKTIGDSRNDNDFKCFIDNDCKLNSASYDSSTIACAGAGSMCVGGKNDGETCPWRCKEELPAGGCVWKVSGDNHEEYCPGGGKEYLCTKTTNIRGLCVGGKNHGLPCGSSADCPTKTYTNTENNKDVIEPGICVGVSLENRKVFQTTTTGRSYELLYELFVKAFGTWVWNDGNVKNTPSGSAIDAYIDTGKWYTAYSKQDLSSQDKTYIDGCPGNTGNKTYPNNACNTNANINIKPPHVYSLLTSKVAPTGYTWGAKDSFSVNLQDKDKVSLGSGSGVATINFFAYADNDQMPIQRVAIDWGDGSPAYQTKGWFKNQKPWCASTGNKVCIKVNGSVKTEDLNKPCNDESSCDVGDLCEVPVSNRLHFGNSTDACEENYFTFKHAYTCVPTNSSWNKCNSTSGEPELNDSYCWDEKTQTCHFKPKVQVLDNWGWCNGVISQTNKTYKAYWNDWDPNNPPQPIIEQNRGCSVGNSSKSQWAYFSGILELKP